MVIQCVLPIPPMWEELYQRGRKGRVRITAAGQKYQAMCEVMLRQRSLQFGREVLSAFASHAHSVQLIFVRPAFVPRPDAGAKMILDTIYAFLAERGRQVLQQNLFIDDSLIAHLSIRLYLLPDSNAPHLSPALAEYLITNPLQSFCVVRIEPLPAESVAEKVKPPRQPLVTTSLPIPPSTNTLLRGRDSAKLRHSKTAMHDVVAQLPLNTYMASFFAVPLGLTADLDNRVAPLLWLMYGTRPDLTQNIVRCDAVRITARHTRDILCQFSTLNLQRRGDTHPSPLYIADVWWEAARRMGVAVL